MFIRQGDNTYDTAAEMAHLLDPLGIEQGYWAVDALEEAICRRAAVDAEAQSLIMQTFSEPLAQLKAKNGYLTEDIVCLSPETPNLDAILDQFDKEHHHSDDEVRIILHGRGIFGITPPEGASFEIHVVAGDLLVVPANTRHWFTLYPERLIVAMRVFKTQAGWTAIYDREAALQT